MTFKLKNLVAATLAGSMLMGFGANAMADSTTDIVNALVAKGVLTEEEGALLTKGREGETEAAEKKKLTGVSVKNKDGSMVLETGDGKNSMALTGRMQFDMRSVGNNAGGETTVNLSDKDTASLADNFEIRRARIGVKGKFFEHFDYEAIANLVGSNTNTIDVAYVNAGMFKQAQLKLGQFKQPFNLEEYGTSSNNIDFMERSYVNQLAPAKKPGLMIHGIPTAGLTYAGSVYQQNNFGETDAGSNGKGFAGRLTANIAELGSWNTKESVLHVGVAGFDTNYGVSPTTSSSTTSAPATATYATALAFRSGGRGMANTYRLQVSGVPTASASYNATGGYNAEVNTKAYGLELAGAFGPFKFQSEYVDATVDATSPTTTAGTASNSVNADVKAYYVEALYMLTGENYAEWYKNGAWGGIKPKQNFDMETGKGKGAWEIGLRYDAYDVNSVAISGGRSQGSTNINNGGGANTYTAGLKWQLTPNMRVLANYSHTKFDNIFTAVDTSLTKISKEDLVMIRSQFSF
jgi:phosphate-selective porin OprO/OprP